MRYNLELYEHGEWKIVVERRSKGVADYWAGVFLRTNPDAELILKKVS